MNANLQSSRKNNAYLLHVVLSGVLVLAVGIAGAVQTLQASAKGLTQIEMATPPSNNNIPGTQIVLVEQGGIRQFNNTVDTRAATTALDDPDPIILNDCISNVGEHSVWYYYVPTADVTLSVDTLSSNYDTLVVVWTGTEGSLSLVECNDDYDRETEILTSKLAFFAEKDTPYFIEVIQWTANAGSPPTDIGNGGDLFFHVAASPSPFGKTGPTNAATSQSLSPTLSWESSAGATSYEYCYSSAPGPCTGWRSAGTSTSVTLNGLAANYTYYWQVRAVNSVGPTEANGGGTWWSFTTQTTAVCTWPAYTAPATSSFADVSMSATYWSWVERLYNGGITAGCGGGNFCPSSEVNRAQMAIFLLRGKHCGSSYVPPAVGSSTGFNDVPLSATYAPWVKQLAAEGITAGCGNGNFCPATAVNRAQMAIFLLRAKHGGTYSPPGVGGSSGFNDVPANTSYAPWVKQLAAEGITAGCGGGNFCPGDNVNRAQMAIFLVRAFGLP